MRRLIKAHQLDPAAFAPFGLAVQEPAEEGLVSVPETIPVDEGLEVSVVRILPTRPFIGELRRHLATWSVWAPLDGPVALAVASPALLDGVPADAVCAFLVAPGQVAAIRPGTWYDGPYPLHAGRVLLMQRPATAGRDTTCTFLEAQEEVEIYVKNRIYSADVFGARPPQGNWVLAALGLAAGGLMVAARYLLTPKPAGPADPPAIPRMPGPTAQGSARHNPSRPRRRP